MVIILNELSLTGQFKDKEEFLDNLENLLHIIKIIDKLGFNLLKEYSFFNSQITPAEKFTDIAQSRDNRIRKIKSFLLKLSNNPPFWNDSQIHSCEVDTYVYNSQDICNTSLAESTERDKIILSFSHQEFLNTILGIRRNDININIYNIREDSEFLDRLFAEHKIAPLEYCLYKFANSNLDFTLLECKYGFDLLNTTQIQEFIITFRTFSNMSWDDITSSDGLAYKQYKPSKDNDWFRRTAYSKKDIYKLRVTQKYRCFGYRENNRFLVLRFEIDHKKSDKG